MLGGYDEMVIGFKECIKSLERVNGNIATLTNVINKALRSKEEPKKEIEVKEPENNYCTILKKGESYKLYKCSGCGSVFIADILGQHKDSDISIRCPVCNREVSKEWTASSGKPLYEVVNEAKENGYDIPLDLDYEVPRQELSDEELAYIEKYTGLHFAQDAVNEIKGSDLLYIDKLIRNARKSYEVEKMIDMKD